MPRPPAGSPKGLPPSLAYRGIYEGYAMPHLVINTLARAVFWQGKKILLEFIGQMLFNSVPL